MSVILDVAQSGGATQTQSRPSDSLGASTPSHGSDPFQHNYQIPTVDLGGLADLSGLAFALGGAI